MKKVALGAVIAISAMFVACGDDSSSTSSSAVNSCDVNAVMAVPVHVCIESSNMPNPEIMCKEALAAKVASMDGTTAFGSGCAAGAKKTCPITTTDGVQMNVYVYDAVLSAQDCDYLMTLLQ